MRVLLSWLKELVNIPDSVRVEELAEKLTLAGLEVGKIHYIGVPQGTPPEGSVMPPSDHLVWDRERLVLGYIYEVKPHPDADRLVLAMVDHGTGAPEQIVTGAPNLFPFLGRGELSPPLISPVAREGAVVYDGHSEVPGAVMTLKERKIRGIPNRHMVCSEMELGISDEHEGIMLLDYDLFKQYAPGTPLQDLLGDVVLDIDLTPNLARNFSMLGVAREVAAILGTELKEPDFSLPNGNGGDHIDEYVKIEIQEPELNPRFTAGMIKDVTMKPSPEWMQRRLKLIGQRPINNIVDVTNYVMFEIGQPTHAFDYDRLTQRAGDAIPTIITRLAVQDETLTTLDEKSHKLEPHHLLVADQKGALSFAGIMGGMESEVQSEPPTRTVLLEAAAWNLINIRQTLSSTKMHSEAAARFSRGVHPAMALRGLARGLRLMAEVSGGRIVPGIIDVYPGQLEAVVVELPVGEVKRLLGFEIPQDEIIAILRRLQFEVSVSGDTLTVTVPDHRLDIGEGVIGQADLIEEIARIYGYNRIPNTQISDAMPPQRSNPSLEMEETTRDILARAGLREVINYRFTTPEREARLIPSGDLASGQRADWMNYAYIELANPISQDKTVMRHTLLAGLLENIALNERNQEHIAMFEVGNVYYPGDKSHLPDEPTRLGIIMTGLREVPGWQADSKQSSYLDFYDLKGVVEKLLAGLQVDPALLRYERSDHSSFHPGRSAVLFVNDARIGTFGEIHPLVREAFDLELDLDRPLLGAEFDLDRLLAYARPGHPIEPIATQPAVYQDISLIVDRATSAADVERTIWKAGAPLLVDVQLFDVYTGSPIPENQKSLAYALTYRHPEETLTDKQVGMVHQKIAKALRDQIGAEVRDKV